jgi:hypothetical protein
MDDSEFLFEYVLRDTNLMTTIDEHISNTIFITKSFEAKYVSPLVLILMTLLKHSTLDIESKMKDDNDFAALLEHFYTYILARIIENPNLTEFNRDDFKKSYEICSRLAVMKIKFSNKNGFCCIRKR